MLYIDKDDARKCVMEGAVASYDCTMDQAMSLVAAMRYSQELGDGHVALLGFGFDKLMEMNSVYLLSKISLTFNRALRLRETFYAETYPRSTHGLLHLRDCAFYPEKPAAGAIKPVPVFTTTGAWVLVNPTTRRLLRPKDFPSTPLVEAPELALGNERFLRIALPQGMEKAGVRKVMYTDIDCNGHLNNCSYAAFLLDYMPPHLQGRFIETVDIHFKSEALLNEEIEVFVKEEAGRVYFCGQHANGRCFEAVCGLSGAGAGI